MLRADATCFCDEFSKLIGDTLNNQPAGLSVTVGIAPTFASISTVRGALPDSRVLVGAQNVHWLESGAHTGELSADMIKEAGASFAIIGHSERRQFYGETDAGVAKRTKAAISKGLTAIVCIGESLSEFDAGRTQEVVETQFKGSLEGITVEDAAKLVIAYEPVWAIGTGKAATPQIAADVHSFIRSLLVSKYGSEVGDGVILQYGGSTSPENIAELVKQPNIQGALIGGASLKPASFYGLIKNGTDALR